MGNLTINGMQFSINTNESYGGYATKKTISQFIPNNTYDVTRKSAAASGNDKYIVNAVDIDWNAGEMPAFNGGPRTINNAGDLLKAIQDASNSGGTISETYTAATSSKLGLIKIGYSQSGQNYPVVLDSNSKAYVNVPWTDNNTTYSAATTSTLGLMKPSNKISTSQTLTSSNGTTSSRYYGVQMDKDGLAFVNIPWTDVSVTAAANHYGYAAGNAKTTEALYKIKIDGAGHITSATAVTTTELAEFVKSNLETYFDGRYQQLVDPIELETPTRGSVPSSISNGSTGNITFTTNVPATVAITDPINGTSTAGWTATVTSLAGTSHTIKITNNRTETTDTSIYVSALKVTVTAVSPNTGTITGWNPNNSTIAIKGKTLTYTITFDSRGGSSVSSKTINAGSSLGTLTTPTYSGYTFNGWYTAASGGTQVTSSTVPTGNTTYYAHWTNLPQELETPTRVSQPDSISNGSTGNITFTTNVPATVTITRPTNGTSTAGWTAAVTSSAGTSHTIKITNNRTETTDTSIYSGALEVTVTAVSPNTGTITGWNPNNGTVAIKGPTPSSTYFSVGTTAPTANNYTTANGATTTIPTTKEFTNTSGTRTYAYILVPANKTVSVKDKNLGGTIMVTEYTDVSISNHKIYKTTAAIANTGTIVITLS